MRRWAMSLGSVGHGSIPTLSGSRRRRRPIGHLISLLLIVCVASSAFAQQKPSKSANGDSADHPSSAARPKFKTYRVSQFKLVYNQVYDGAPDLTDVNDHAEIILGSRDGVFAAKENGLPEYKRTLASLSSDKVREFEWPAIKAITLQISNYYTSKGYLAVYVDPLVRDKDRENPDHTDLTLKIYMGVVKQVRSVASGDRFASPQRVDLDEHQFIRDHSPVTTQPGKSLLNKAEIDDYVLSLNRHPGRHVDVAISQAETTVNSEAVVDYLVAENKPWNVTLQASNTGTRQTHTWRERLSYTNNQLTNRDDILIVDGVTAGFNFGGSQSQSVSFSYEAPLFRTPISQRTFRWRIFGSYDAFTASDLGTNNPLHNFIGEESGGGAEIIANLWQRRDKFIDALGGVQYNYIRTNLNPTDLNTTGWAQVVEPYVGVRAESSTDTYDLSSSITGRFGHSFDPHSPQPTPAPAKPVNSINSLGRTGANVDWPLLQGDINYSFFLEPILYPDAFNNQLSTLANEVQFSLRGQSSLDRRLIAQEEEAAGGLYSVRGYPESVVAGDDVVIFSSEYRLHVPRLFKVQKDPSQTPLFGHPFRYSPQETYGRPDWDLTLRTFFDAAFTHSYRNTSMVTETTDHGLFGTGLGLDLTFSPPHLPYIDVRCDWGIALHTIADGEEPVSRYSTQFHYLVTFLY